MAIPKFTLYKHVKLDSGWRYCKAAWHSNFKIKPNVVLVNGVEDLRGRFEKLQENPTADPVLTALLGIGVEVAS